MLLWKCGNMTTLRLYLKMTNPIQNQLSQYLTFSFKRISIFIFTYRQVKKILTDEAITAIKPKRMFVLCKGDIFFKVNSNSKNKIPTKRKF